MTKEEYLKEFEKITTEMLKLTKAKNSDYIGTSNDPFKNFRAVEALGICSVEQGFLTRMTDKLARINSFVQKGLLEVKDESVHDTLLDLSNYAILLRCYIKSKQGHTRLQDVASDGTHRSDTVRTIRMPIEEDI